MFNHAVDDMQKVISISIKNQDPTNITDEDVFDIKKNLIN